MRIMSFYALTALNRFSNISPIIFKFCFLALIPARSYLFTQTRLVRDYASTTTRQHQPMRAILTTKDETSAQIEDSIIGIVSDEFRDMIKNFKKAKSPKKMFEEVIRLSNENILDRNMTVHAFKNLQRMNRTDLALQLVPVWEQLMVHIGPEYSPTDLILGHNLMKSCCMNKRMDLATSVAAHFGVYSKYNPLTIESSTTSTVSKLFEAKKVLLPDLAHGFVSDKSFATCITVLEHMEQESIKMSSEVAKHILKSFLRGESSNQIRKSLRLIVKTGLELHADVDFIQILSSCYLRSLEFVKGVVSIETLPPEKYPEVCFIGRSNVGKSSLINMLTNIKKLAFVSKTPGKTSEFNYFNATGLVGADKEKFHFYLVDVPGVGYAEKNKVLRKGWLELLQDYTSSRGSLRLIFHLVDSRHGLLAADEQCLSLIPTLSPNVQYCIALTKSDKRSGEGRLAIVDEVREKLREYTSRDLPVILCSSESREGGTKLWSTILDAFSGDHIPLK